ncbi:hypothetical protein ACFW9F_16270 [Streptomyces sp. NPDC059506]|uniref:hypothetical protein n=1 Tax=Streptomyces sp. NPDC059506 TaxID=3347751 RepID=UPI0036B058A7
MPDRILTLPDSTDQFVVTDRPAPTLTHRYRMLPDGMNHTLFAVVRAHQVRTGDIVTAFFTDGPGIRHTRHVLEAFTAYPSAFGDCPAECDACEDAHAHGATTDRYVCLDAANDVVDCVITFRNTPVAIIRANVAASFPPLDTAPPLPGLFALDDEHGPYEALPVSRSWGPYDAISVTRTTAEQITTDLPQTHAGRHLTCHWLHDTLLIASDPRLRTEPGRPGRIIRPDADGRYRIGGLWPWEEWPGQDENPDDGSESDPTREADEDTTAETSVTRALAAWGITAHRSDDAGNTWLVIAHDQTRQGFPNMLGDPYAVLYLYNEASDDGEEEITVTRAPMAGDHWHVLTGDGTGTERKLVTLPADQLPACAEAIAAWVTDPPARPHPGEVLPGIRTDAIHTYFGLSYANYLVRPRTLLQSMPDQWQTRFVALLNELDTAFQHLPQAEAYDVTPGKWCAVRDMTEDEMHSVNIRRSELADGTPYLIRDDWHDQDPEEEFFLEEQDPVAHYNRGRTRVEPHTGGAR